jgi:DDB1- and CUL4-associated factor 1
LLELVSQFLLDEGFTNTVQAMQHEKETMARHLADGSASPPTRHSHRSRGLSSSAATPQLSSASPWSSLSYTPHIQPSAVESPSPALPPLHPSGGVKRSHHDVDHDTEAAVPPETGSVGAKRVRSERDRHSTGSIGGPPSSSKPLSVVKASNPPLSTRKKMYREAYAAPTLHRPHRQTPSASGISIHRKASTLDSGMRPSRFTDSRRHSSGTNHGHTHDNNVSLTSIVTSYLRQQHQQCQYPISVVPQFSLFGKHKCPAPDSSSISMWDVLQQRRVFGGKQGRSRSNAEEDIRLVDCSRIMKHRVYSEYRQWRCFGEVQDNFVTAAAFSADSRKVWVGGGAGSDGQGIHYPQGGHIRVHDIHSTQELGYWDLDMNIDSLVAPTRPDIQILMTTTVATEDRYPMDRSPSNFSTCVWRAGVKASDQNASEYFLDNRSGPLVHWDNLGSPVFSPNCTSVCGIPSPFETQSDGLCALIFDTETGVQIESFRKEGLAMGAYSRSYSAPNACFGLGVGGENIVLATGILWDCRTGGIISDFDKLSSHGFGLFHPNGNSLLIDNAVWDMRRFCLLETVKMLENGAQAHFCTDGDGSVLFGCSPYTFDDYMSLAPHSLPHSTFFALDASDYSLIHTQDLDGDEDVVVWGAGVQSDPCGLGYLLSVEMRCNQLRRDDSCCRVREIGRRKPNYQDNDADDAQTEDEEWEGDNGGVDDEEDIDDDDHDLEIEIESDDEDEDDVAVLVASGDDEEDDEDEDEDEDGDWGSDDDEDEEGDGSSDDDDDT